MLRLWGGCLALVLVVAGSTAVSQARRSILGTSYRVTFIEHRGSSSAGAQISMPVSAELYFGVGGTAFLQAKFGDNETELYVLKANELSNVYVLGRPMTIQYERDGVRFVTDWPNHIASHLLILAGRKCDLKSSYILKKGKTYYDAFGIYDKIWADQVSCYKVDGNIFNK